MSGHGRQVPRWRAPAAFCAALTLVAVSGDLAPGQQQSLAGAVVGVDDTGGPDYVVTGTLIALPQRQGIAWLRAAHPRLSTMRFRFADMKFRPARLRAMGAVIVDTDDDGHFRLDVPAGRYLLCWSPDWWSTAIWGCDPIRLPEHGTIRAVGTEGFTAHVE